MKEQNISKTFIRIFMLVYLVILYVFYFRNNSAIHYLLIDSFLGYLPIELSFHMSKPVKKLGYFLLCLVYLLFLPNNAYLLTDLVHLNRIEFYLPNQTIMTLTEQSWLMFVISVGGILFLVYGGYRTLHQVIDQIAEKLNLAGYFYHGCTALILLISSCGVYIGRFVRFNSIDVFSEPVRILRQVDYSIDKEGIFFIFIFTILQIFLFQIVNRNILIESGRK